MILRFLPARRWRSRSLRLGAALALAAGLAGCGTTEGARSAPAQASAPAAPAGTRWSTADLTALAYAGLAPDAHAQARRRLEALRAEYGPRAAAAGAELLWDLGGDHRLGDSPALYIDPALALPAASAARVRTVDLEELAYRQPQTRAFHDRLLEAERELGKEIDRMSDAVDALVAERARLAERREAAAAAALEGRIKEGQARVLAFAQENAAALQRRMRLFLAEQRAALAAGLVARARAGEATVLLEVRAPRLTGEPSVVFVAEALSPAPDGGLRTGPVPEAVVRTIDREWLYERHPRTLVVHAEVRAADQQATQELAPLKAEVAALEGTLRRQQQGGEAPAAEQTRAQLEGARTALRAREKQSRDELGARLAAHRKAMFAEIAQAAGAVAGRTGAHLVLDTAAEAAGPRPVAHAARGLDLTAEVGRELGIASGR